MSIKYSVFSVVFCICVDTCLARNINVDPINKSTDFNQAASCPEQTIDEITFNKLELNGREMLKKMDLCAEKASKNYLNFEDTLKCLKTNMPSNMKFLQCHKHFIETNAASTKMSEIENNLDKEFVLKMYDMSYDTTNLRELIDDQQLFNVILGKFPTEIPQQQSSNQIQKDNLHNKLATFIIDVLKMKAH